MLRVLEVLQFGIQARHRVYPDGTCTLIAGHTGVYEVNTLNIGRCNRRNLHSSPLRNVSTQLRTQRQQILLGSKSTWNTIHPSRAWTAVRQALAIGLMKNDTSGQSKLQDSPKILHQL